MKICIVCQKDCEGKAATKIKEDVIIRTIRGFKQFFKIAANNELYVCEDDVLAHAAKRQSFEKSMVFFGLLAAAVVVLLLGTILLSGRIDVWAMVSAFIIGLFILLFAVVFKYAPALEKVPEAAKKPAVSEKIEQLEDK